MGKKMNIGIVTHYDVHNHGAVLQLNALVNVLREEYNIGALTFDKDLRYIDDDLQNKYKISIKSIPYYIGYLFNQGFGKTLYNYKKHKTLETYKSDKSLIMGKYGDTPCDLVVIGSDEVFSTKYGISNEFFNINSPYKRVISYAGTFGNTTYDDLIEKKEIPIIEDGLKSIINISVRDNNSEKIMSELGINTTLVCDPVILYGYKNEIANVKVKKLPKYILVYSYDNNMNGEEVSKIKTFAKKNNLKVVSAGFYHKWCDYNINCDPIELLGYFKNAEFVITDTFHGSVMSIITNTNLIVKVRDNSQKLGWLLKEYNLDGRISTTLDDIEEKYNNKVDYDAVNAIVEENRQASINWLKDAVNE